jgi:lysophospholipase L1-like esterase
VTERPQIVAERVKDVGGHGVPIPRGEPLGEVVDQPQCGPCIKAIAPDHRPHLGGHGPQKEHRPDKVGGRRNQPRCVGFDGEPQGRSDILREPTQARGRSGGVALGNRWSNLPLGVRLVALMFLSLVLIAGLELWARGLKPQLPGWGGPRGASGLMAAHPTRLWGMPPGEKSNAEGSTANINSLGLRGAMPEQPRPSGRQRIMSLGDSAFFGFGVNDGQVFTHQLGSILQERGVDVDAVNAGVSGYSIAQHRVLLDEFGWDLEPTLLLMCNVWSDNTWDTFEDEDLIASRRFAARNPLTRSALVKLAAAWLAGLGDGESGRVIVWNSAGKWPEGKKRRVPLDRWIGLTDAVMREAADRGIGVVMLKPTNSFLLDGEQNGPSPGWQPYFDAMDALAKHHGVPLIDVTAVFQAAIESGTPNSELLWDKMHPSAAGHAVLAKAIAATLLDVGWPQNRLLPRPEEFAGDEIEDLPLPEWTDDAGAGSPQVNLFELTDIQMEQIAESQDPSAAPGGPPGQPGRPDGELLQPLREPSKDDPAPSPRFTWTVGIQISGGQPPYRVKLQDPQGRTIGSARLGSSGPIKLKVREEVSVVTAVVTDAQDQTAQAEASPSSASVSLNLGG